MAAVQEEAEVALGLGSNLGDRAAHLRRGVEGLSAVLRITSVSAVYRSAAVGWEDQPDFLNAVILGSTLLGPRTLLEEALRVEAAEGRRRSFPNAPRVLDLDIVLWGDLVLRTPDLTIPHPRWRERSFVLAPLAEVAPDMVDPETGRTVQRIWDARRAELPPVERVAPPEALWRSPP